MVLDCHIHIFDAPPDRDGLVARMREAGVDGGVLISIPPGSFAEWARGQTAAGRLQNLFEWCAESATLYPFYWIDPTEPDALDQVAMALDMGVKGFKVICTHFYPRDERAAPVYRAIADAGKPLLFHSGILFDGQDSSRFNRPAEFEAMLDVPRLRFAMAHISWPWCDELIAVCGKFLAARRHRPENAQELFVDTTPGTPGIYREEAFRKLFTVGYDVRSNVMFGTDKLAHTYSPEMVRKQIERDTAIMQSIGLDPETIADVLGGNLRRFVGE